MAGLTTYDTTGIREDLSDIIYNISPTDTPFMSGIGKTKATNTKYEWQTDSLGAVAANAAVEGAILIAKYAKKVFLVYRGEKLWRPEPILLDTLEKTDNVDVLLKNNVTKLIGSDFGGLEEIELENKYNNQNRFKIDGLMIEAGADPRVEIPISLGINLDDETNEVAVDKDQKTNVSGIFAARDITNGSNLKQTITAASQGAISALSAYNYCLENK